MKTLKIRDAYIAIASRVLFHNSRINNCRCTKHPFVFIYLLSFASTLTAGTFVVDNIKYSVGLNNTVTVMSNTTKYSGSITIPSSVSNEGIAYTVTDIGYSAFLNCTGLTAISLPATLTAIRQQAFSGCSAITTVNLPASVTDLGASAFAYCSSLTSINIPRVKGIDNNTFTECSKLTSLVLPASVKYIGQNAFYNCTKLTVNIPDSVESIGATAYYKTLLNTITLPSTLTTMAITAFDSTPWYTAQPAGMVYLGDWVYGYKGTLPSSIEIKEGIKYITQGIFMYSFNLVSVKLPTSITAIPNSAFMGCISLVTINLPENIKYIDDIAFFGCAKLASITFPSGIERIGDRALDNTAWYTAQANGNVYAANWYYKYKGTKPSNAEVFIANGTVGIADLAFLEADIYNLKSVHIPSTVRYIGNSAFQGCRNLTSIYALPSIPPDLSSKIYVFLDVPKTTCNLYVPTGSVNLYKSANQWKEFLSVTGINTATDELKADDFSLTAGKQTIYLKNRQGRKIQVYNRTGQLIYSGNEKDEIKVGFSGVFLVKVGDICKKLVVD